MLSSINYEMVLRVTKSWDAIKFTPGYEDTFGELIFVKLLELAPHTAQVLDLELSDKMRDDPRFTYLAGVTFDMVNLAVDMLGPDLEPIEEELVDLGTRHVAYGVKPEFFVPMGQAIVYGLEEFLGDELTKEDKCAWLSLYTFMSSKMIEGIQKRTAKLNDKKR